MIVVELLASDIVHLSIHGNSIRNKKLMVINKGEQRLK